MLHTTSVNPGLLLTKKFSIFVLFCLNLGVNIIVQQFSDFLVVQNYCILLKMI